jgi:hypothetical protein
MEVIMYPIKITFMNESVAQDFIDELNLKDAVRLSNSVLFEPDELCSFIPAMVKCRGYTDNVTDWDKQQLK